ncbi:hypothetical protein BDP27DRAFT_53479 [Rhodocollybia butyracea]|uniref:Zn(2)-C6 fungal-type domain-containing protein n=1 Tax=Rhodocollybia butyracea TaxID=206335 RepID=A0A9P5PGU5_9AGAR|nr:hypothetical protein BDP27DRAFT_53479 [Rhodocollybia butyracea]
MKIWNPIKVIPLTLVTDDSFGTRMYYEDLGPYQCYTWLVTDDISGTPSSLLTRGHACVRCRQLKRRCSGTRPVCRQCELSNASDECEYLGRNDRTRSTILQEEIDRLQNRLLQLEHPGEAQGGGIPLHQPYVSPDQGSNPALSDLQKRNLIDHFLNAGPLELGFFLHPGRFRTSALLPYPDGHPLKPTGSLMDAIYLWGLHLSPDSPEQQKELLFDHARLDVASALSGDHPNKILHTVQSLILLARYCFVNLKHLEGRCHIGHAVSIIRACGFGSIRSNRTSSFISQIAPPVDIIEEGERIMSMHFATSTSKCWAVILDVLADVDSLSNPHSPQPDTPWPQEPEVYEQGGDFLAEGYSFTLVNFMKGIPTLDRGDSSLAMLAKAIVCWHRANTVAKCIEFHMKNVSLSQDHSDQMISAYTECRQCIANFLPTITEARNLYRPTPAKAVILLEARSIAHAANITAASIFPFLADADSTERARSSLISARTILDLLNSPTLGGLQHINPVMGEIWQLSYRLLVEDLKRKISMGGTRDLGQRQLENSLKMGTTVIDRLSKTSLFIKSRLDIIRGYLSTVEIDPY